ncbi:MAG: alpha/beta fold hydrolase [Lachnospiraceae bacterium]
MKPNIWKFNSYTNVGEIYVEIWTPKGTPRAVIQIVHGMAEHIGRYADFAAYLVEHGCAVVMNDQVGHGQSIRDEASRGYFGEKDGGKNLLLDINHLHERAVSEFPDVPMVLLGHSMGSFLARAYAASYPQDFDKYIFSGTAGHNPLLGLGRIIAKIERKRNGAMKPSELLNKMSFGSNNKAFKPIRTASDWLTSDEKIVDAFVKDPLCGFTFTAEAMSDLFEVMRSVSGIQWAKQVPDVPIFIFSGEKDPVSSSGKGVRQVVDWLEKTGHPQVLFKLYEGRHEMLNEVNKQEVFEDILGFLELN